MDSKHRQSHNILILDSRLNILVFKFKFINIYCQINFNIYSSFFCIGICYINFTYVRICIRICVLLCLCLNLYLYLSCFFCYFCVYCFYINFNLHFFMRASFTIFGIVLFLYFQFFFFLILLFIFVFFSF